LGDFERGKVLGCRALNNASVKGGEGLRLWEKEAETGREKK